MYKSGSAIIARDCLYTSISQRRELPPSIVLHGSHDLIALGTAVAKHDRAGVALLLTELANSAPAIAAPMDSMSSVNDVAAAVRGAALIRCLSDDDFDTLRRLGPVRSMIEAAMEETLSKDLSMVEHQTVSPPVAAP